MKSRAVIFLKKKNIQFETIEYKHEEKGAEFASMAVGFPIERTIKTLVVDIGKGKFALALMPGHKKLDLKKMARACGVKKANMAETSTAERLTGYVVGGISPFGVKHRFLVVMDKSLSFFDEVMINGGKRGLMLKMTPHAILDALECDMHHIAR